MTFNLRIAILKREDSLFPSLTIGNQVEVSCVVIPKENIPCLCPLIKLNFLFSKKSSLLPYIYMVRLLGDLGFRRIQEARIDQSTLA
jgi:hypothetical protein